MVRGRKLRRIARCVAFVCAVAAVAAPATAGAQSGVDEYTLDIPGGGGSGSSDQGAPPSSGASATSAAAGAAGGSSGSGSSEGSGSSGEGSGSGGGGADAKRDAAARGAGQLDELRSGASGASAPLATDSRSAPEVVADTLFDGAMLPLLGALVAITGVGAWRLVRHRRTLTGTAG